MRQDCPGDIIAAAAAAIRDHGLIEEGQRVVAGVSGGADSVALLLCLAQLAPRLGFSLCVAHLNHGIRGAAAEADMAFVAELCKEHNLPFFAGRADAPGLARARGRGLEEAARHARFAFLEEARRHFQGDKIALAHHMEDQAETVLLHLFRGSGLTGLCGMAYAQGAVIRPLLGCHRRDIEAFLAAQGQPFCTDASNAQAEAALRNRVRLELLPYLAARFNPEVVEALCRTAALAGTDAAYLQAQAVQALAAARRADGYDCAALAALPEALRSRALALALEERGGRDLCQTHIRLLESLLQAPTGSHLDLPGVRADREYGLLRLCPARQAPPAAPAFCLPLNLSGDTETPWGVFQAAPYSGPLLRDPFRAVLDMDKLPACLEVRPRQPGDTFYPLGAPGRKKLKDFLIDKKVPRPQRGGPMIFAGSRAVFLPGYGISEEVKVDSGTRRMLLITYKKSE